MDDPQAAVEKRRSRIRKLQESHHQPNEQETKQALITPMLCALGWDCEDRDVVRMEYSHRSQTKVDYALMIDGTPRLFVEAKPLGRDVGEYRWREQAVNYANAAGVRWCVLTDGNFWMVYRSNAEGDIDQKLFLETWLRGADGRQPPHESIEVLALLSLDSIATNGLDSRWERMDVDRRGGRALRELFEERDGALVRLVQKRSGLTRGEVLSLFSRARVTIEPGAVAAPPAAVPEAPREAPPQRPGEGRTLKLSGFMGARKKGVSAQCLMVGEGKDTRYIVRGGSTAVAELGQHSAAYPQWQKLVKDGTLSPVRNGRREFTRDCEFANPSAPARIILGSSSNGFLCWEDEVTGQPLDEFRPTPKTAKRSRRPPT